MVLKNKKKHRIPRNDNVGAGEDKISNLPDAIIHHILSFIPTKCAMSTCILSKRWKCVSNSIPILDLREGSPGHNCTQEERHLQTQQFMDFLDTVLYLHEKPKIQKFYLIFDNLFNESRVSKWIGVVIKRKVEELFLIGPHTSFIFPLSLFTCDSLTVLDLNRTTLNVPNTVSLPKLKKLRLFAVTFVNGIFPNHLLSNCPILEDLSLGHCWLSQSQDLCITSPALRHLCIWYVSPRDCTLKISAPNLSTICCELQEPADFVIDSFPSLDEAEISMLHAAKIQMNLLQKLSNVKLLKIYYVDFLVQSEVDILSSCLPAFNNLIHLEVGINTSRDISGSGFVSTMRTIFGLLQLPPNLESIVFSESIHIPDEVADDCFPVDPKWSLPHLKSIKFKEFDCEPTQLNVIKLFLKHAGFLETVTLVKSSGRLYDKKQFDVMEELLNVEKPAKCLVKFLWRSEDTSPFQRNVV